MTLEYKKKNQFYFHDTFKAALKTEDVNEM